eukprot:364782-Chlamydomonas_euryale.AAC.16
MLRRRTARRSPSYARPQEAIRSHSVVQCSDLRSQRLPRCCGTNCGPPLRGAVARAFLRSSIVQRLRWRKRQGADGAQRTAEVCDVALVRACMHACVNARFRSHPACVESVLRRVLLPTAAGQNWSQDRSQKSQPNYSLELTGSYSDASPAGFTATCSRGVLSHCSQACSHALFKIRYFMWSQKIEYGKSEGVTLAATLEVSREIYHSVGRFSFCCSQHMASWRTAIRSAFHNSSCVGFAYEFQP